jgi:hypothetical protein
MFPAQGAKVVWVREENTAWKNWSAESKQQAVMRFILWPISITSLSIGEFAIDLDLSIRSRSLNCLKQNCPFADRIQAFI